MLGDQLDRPAVMKTEMFDDDARFHHRAARVHQHRHTLERPQGLVFGRHALVTGDEQAELEPSAGSALYRLATAVALARKRPSTARASFRPSSSSKTEPATAVAIHQSPSIMPAVPKIACAGGQCTATA